MKLLWLVLALIAVPLVCAKGYYADVVLDVAQDGSVTISGVSNHPDLQPGTTQAFTSKNKEYWLVNVMIPDEFDDVVVTVVLPQNAALNYVTAKSNLNIYSENNRVIVKRVASNSSIAFTAQYKLEGKTEENMKMFAAGLALLGLLVVSVVLFLTRKPRKHKEEKHVVHEHTVNHLDGLPARQKEIVELLRKSGGKLTQKQIEQNMSIPKSSVSRNIDSLERRGIVTKESFGMTNVISLK